MGHHILLDSFVNPQSIAVIGVSSRTGPGTFNVLERMLASGYQGVIYPVNPRGGSILGLKVYKSVKDIDGHVDLAVIATPRTAVPGVVKQCTEMGIKAVVIITQGFSDAHDEAGMLMHQEIVNTIRGTKTRVVGPNTIGIVNTFANVDTSFVSFNTRTSPVGIVCQSGILLNASQDFAGGLGIGIDIGNTCDIGFTECMEYLADHDQIQVINLHMEGLRDGRRFLAAAREVTPRKPVLVLKTGSSEEGARAASSHSGSLAGEDAVFSAAFAQSGIIRVEDSTRLAELNQTFITYRQMKGKRIAFMTISGGAGIMAVDACSKNGLKAARLSDQTITALAGIFPDWMKVGNPADIWPAGMAKGYGKITALALDKILADDNVDAVLCATTGYLDPANDPLNTIDVINDIAARYPDKPTAVWVFGPHKQQYAKKFRDAKVAVAYNSPESALYCLAKLYQYHSTIKEQQYELYQAPQDTNHAGAAAIIAAGMGNHITALNEQALDVVEAYGIPVVRRGLAQTPEQALQLAEDLGYPVALKIASSDITHKSDAGGVILNIKSGYELVKAYDKIMQNALAHRPDARINGVLVQSQITRGTEVILGGRQDPQFGPVLVYGLGGIYTELVRDVTFRIAPVTRDEALEMIKETQSYKILSGARGQEPGDIEGLVDCIVRMGALLCDLPEITEVDINPLLVKPSGCLALDARLIPAYRE
ncbi:acetate--CoA ligase family protein [Desulfoscipio gibsoniae]|uniref:Acyl-CoA synthetase (NDP forming) n=1 Tax=Desulfoscipio gibsoniae DSM 7213 TaxID=767817 RepID=R4KR75_9FIRM|nr:acetate--CoA ligase family protein [Desulfoscipio gibsoniae]AGL03065.1 acyl-CoA synthetase (NDP forming) [Desulfoscipio gibsoniae DSM 7213]